MTSEKIPVQVEKLKASADDALELLDAAKEALVAILNKYTLPEKIMFDTALSVIQVVTEYKNSEKLYTKEEMKQAIVDVVDGQLGTLSLNTSDIMEEFERVLDDHLPKQE